MDRIKGWEWRMLGPPVTDPPPVERVVVDFTADPRCQGGNDFNRPVRLTVFDADGRSDIVQQNITVQPAAGWRNTSDSIRLRFISRIRTDEAVEGWVSWNGAPLGPATSAAPREYDVRWTEPEARIEVTLTSRAPENTYWELDLRANEALAAGSLKIDAGVAVVVEPRRVVFRLSGVAGETARVSLRRR